VSEEEGGRRILLGVNTGSGTVMLGPIRFGLRLDSLVVCLHIHLTINYEYNQQDATI